MEAVELGSSSQELAEEGSLREVRSEAAQGALHGTEQGEVGCWKHLAD